MGSPRQRRFSFDHTAKVRLVYDGRPVTVTMTRNLTYHLWPAEEGNPVPWWIVNWDVNHHPTMTDDASGQAVTS